jgi:hypothetical protein
MRGQVSDPEPLASLHAALIGRNDRRRLRFQQVGPGSLPTDTEAQPTQLTRAITEVGVHVTAIQNGIQVHLNSAAECRAARETDRLKINRLEVLLIQAGQTESTLSAGMDLATATLEGATRNAIAGVSAENLSQVGTPEEHRSSGISNAALQAKLIKCENAANAAATACREEIEDLKAQLEKCSPDEKFELVASCRVDLAAKTESLHRMEEKLAKVTAQLKTRDLKPVDNNGFVPAAPTAIAVEGKVLYRVHAEKDIDSLQKLWGDNDPERPVSNAIAGGAASNIVTSNAGLRDAMQLPKLLDNGVQVYVLFGPSGTGKTWTMFGNPTGGKGPSEVGTIQEVINTLLTAKSDVVAVDPDPPVVTVRAFEIGLGRPDTDNTVLVKRVDFSSDDHAPPVTRQAAVAPSFFRVTTRTETKTLPPIADFYSNIEPAKVGRRSSDLVDKCANFTCSQLNGENCWEEHGTCCAWTAAAKTSESQGNAVTDKNRFSMDITGETWKAGKESGTDQNIGVIAEQQKLIMLEDLETDKAKATAEVKELKLEQRKTGQTVHRKQLTDGALREASSAIASAKRDIKKVGTDRWLAMQKETVATTASVQGMLKFRLQTQRCTARTAANAESSRSALLVHVQRSAPRADLWFVDPPGWEALTPAERKNMHEFDKTRNLETGVIVDARSDQSDKVIEGLSRGIQTAGTITSLTAKITEYKAAMEVWDAEQNPVALAQNPVALAQNPAATTINEKRIALFDKQMDTINAFTVDLFNVFALRNQPSVATVEAIHKLITTSSPTPPSLPSTGGAAESLPMQTFSIMTFANVEETLPWAKFYGPQDDGKFSPGGGDNWVSQRIRRQRFGSMDMSAVNGVLQQAQNDPIVMLRLPKDRRIVYTQLTRSQRVDLTKIPDGPVACRLQERNFLRWRAFWKEFIAERLRQFVIPPSPPGGGRAFPAIASSVFSLDNALRVAETASPPSPSQLHCPA